VAGFVEAQQAFGVEFYLFFRKDEAMIGGLLVSFT
jgi:hypothetical protein